MAEQTSRLFDEFNPVSSKEWKQQIQYELKGADYNQTLIWESPEGIKVKPFYHNDDFTPGSTSKAGESFKICQDIFVFDVEKSVWRAKDSIKRGAESIRFIIDNPEIDIASVLNELPLEGVTIFLDLKFLSTAMVAAADKIAQEKTAKIFCIVDPVSQLASDGNWFGKTDNFTELQKIADTAKIPFLSVNGGLYQNAGANIVQQIAYTLGHANEYFNQFSTLGQPVVLQMAMGSNYFFEISKLRALRRLFDLIATEYGHSHDCHILAVPTHRNKTLYDYNVNMLRTTTECMSAILGGADTVANLPYDAIYHKSNEFGERISRNQLLVLKHESYLDKVINAADGSYYIESLTDELAEKALVLFKDIEANGGFLKQLKDGTIQRKISESADKEQALFDDGKEILLGTNKYPNKSDRMSGDLELFPFVKKKPRKTLITPIIAKRLAEKMEQERLESEKQS